MECATPVQLYNFLIATTGTVIIDCRPEDLYLKCRLNYPLLIHIALEKLEKLSDTGNPKELCEHQIAFSSSTSLPEKDCAKTLQDIELLIGPYERCVFRQRTKSKVILINEHPKIPPRVASFAQFLIAEAKCLAVYHTAFEFVKFSEMYPFVIEKISRRTSNCSEAMRTSLSLELDEMSIMKQKKALIVQYPNAVLGKALFLGTRRQALNLSLMSTMKITHIIRAHDIRENRCREDLERFDVYQRAENIKYLDVCVDDKLGTEIGIFLKPCINFYNDAIKSSKDSIVFVHCNMGISRSSTIVISILMTNEHMSLKDALNYAQECRHVVQPNYSFMKELIKYEISVFGSNSIKMTELTKLNAHYSRAYAMDSQDKSCTLL